jgi:hypothetical protein
VIDSFTDAELADVGFLMESTATLLDQQTGQLIPYDVDRIAPHLQRSIISYVGSPPKDENGYNKWLVVLASRQVGKSVCASLACYYAAATRPGISGAVIADKRERSESLFRSILANHQNMPEDLRPPTIPNRESRQLTIDHPAGTSKLKTLSAESSNVGIGRSFDMLHLSELPFWGDAAGAYNGLYPALVNRAETTVIMESTPAQLSQPSAGWYRDMCMSARQRGGRYDFLFAPYYSSLLNERKWDSSWSLEPEEIRLMERFGPKNGQPASAPGEWRYLTLENLAFRRQVLRDDVEVRRYPELFKVFYPVDATSCWVSQGGGAIPSHVLEKHLDGLLIPWTPTYGYQEYEAPEAAAQYVIGVDPAGLGGGDQASIQVLKVYAEEWTQVACFASNSYDPLYVARLICDLAERYNDATVIVENNGAGLATVLALQEANSRDGRIFRDEKGMEKRYHVRNLYYHKLAGKARERPGIPATSKSKGESLNYLIDALMETLVLRDTLTVEQLQSYNRDSETQASEKWGILNPTRTPKGRREKHHWDRVSALGWAVYAARNMPVRFRKKTPEEMQQDVEDLEEKIRNQDYLRADRRDWLEKRKMTKETAARGGRAGPRKIHK